MSYVAKPTGDAKVDANLRDVQRAIAPLSSVIGTNAFIVKDQSLNGVTPKRISTGVRSVTAVIPVLVSGSPSIWVSDKGDGWVEVSSSAPVTASLLIW